MPFILYRYILREIVPSFLIGLFIFTLVLLMEKVMQIVEWIVEKGLDIGEVLQLFGCLLPSFFVLTLPCALLLSVLLTFSRIYADNELYAFKTAGISLYRLMPPVYLFGVLVTAGSLMLTTWIGPQSTRTFQSIFYSVASQNFFMALKERVFFDQFPGFVIYIEHVDYEDQKIQGVFIAHESYPGSPVYYFAQEGRVYGSPDEKTVLFELKNGSFHHSPASNNMYQTGQFESYSVKFDLGEFFAPFQVHKQRMEELTIFELRDEIEKKTHDERQTRKLLLHFHQRFSLPFASIIFITLGIPLSLLSQRAVRYTGFSLSIGVVLFYFLLLQVGSSLVMTGKVPGLLGAWIPNLVMGILGLYLLKKKAEEKPLKILESYAEAIQSFQETVRKRFQPDQGR